MRENRLISQIPKQVGLGVTATSWGFLLPPSRHMQMMPAWLFRAPYMKRVWQTWRKTQGITGGKAFTAEGAKGVIVDALWPNGIDQHVFSRIEDLLNPSSHHEPKSKYPVHGSRMRGALFFSSSLKSDYLKVARSESGLSRLRGGHELATDDWYKTAGEATSHNHEWLLGADTPEDENRSGAIDSLVLRILRLPRADVISIMAVDKFLRSEVTTAPAWLHPYLIAASLNPVFVAWFNELERQTKAPHAAVRAEAIGHSTPPPEWLKPLIKKRGPPGLDEIYMAYH